MRAEPKSDELTVNWSDELEEFHEELSRDHPLEVLTRSVMLDRLGRQWSGASLVDLGCSTGYLIEDVNEQVSGARIAGFDLVMAGLRKAHAQSPAAIVAQADACFLPLGDQSIDGLVSANLLEHIPNDLAALGEIYRVLRPGSRAVIVVPAGPRLYDYYDRFLHHERRYGRGELARKATSIGFTVEEDSYIGTTVFPAFWAMKKLNRLRFVRLEGAALEAKVLADYSGTDRSEAFRVACQIDRWMLHRGISVPAGIRGLTVVRRPTT